MRLRVMCSDAADIHCTARLLSPGDVMLAGNQHLTTLDRDTGHQTFSTIAIGWSVKAGENRFEDTHLDNGAALMTDVSLVTTRHPSSLSDDEGGTDRHLRARLSRRRRRL